MLAIRELAEHCAGNRQSFLMETGQETPTTVMRTIKDVDRPNLGVGLDTANLILYGKANPVDAVNILGPHVRSVHAKDGKWPVNPDRSGGRSHHRNRDRRLQAGFHQAEKAGLHAERSRSNVRPPVPKQIEDVKQEKAYLERLLNQIL